MLAEFSGSGHLVAGVFAAHRQHDPRLAMKLMQLV
jgi:hypothetical protein